ncbi:hypothetical protein PF003_g15404 [Phytophthora fragariae]|nr:hypothetical protein PF003_g15403 [Phytophthora fragariae]KAE8900440.1 hypothetical protein PF003_g15404 [Phytophthora fragariae]
MDLLRNAIAHYQPAHTASPGAQRTAHNALCVRVCRSPSCGGATSHDDDVASSHPNASPLADLQAVIPVPSIGDQRSAAELYLQQRLVAAGL